MAQIQQRMASYQGEIEELRTRVKSLETIAIEIENIESCLKGTPALGLKNRFVCDCGATGFVAIHLRCTKCGQETWWGWHPK